eukprot:gnl/Hemi2/26847_TR9031_c0_g1_i1.p2 gnl/Hemi2/26847_TR9031_c0_g1~~gnl/Hemi2/26847_TR9031_c0_g1_i1.p2  ORF type:complete len:117 (+),score=26.34 gnl/Hemi2/26847_TR9031_c0_g1_i1:381-731(+)
MQYVFFAAKTRRGTHWNRYGPFYLITMGLPFIMADLTRHVVQDAGLCICSMYNNDGSLSMYGWLFTIVFTYTGFALLFVGIMWSVEMWKKISKLWSKLRGTQAPRHLTPSDKQPLV